jgi:hypothetical protein
MSKMAALAIVMIVLAFGPARTASLAPNPELGVAGGLLPLSRRFTPEEPAGPSEFEAGVSYGIDWFLFGKRAAARVGYPNPNLRYDMAHGSGSDPYAGVDRFDRVVDLLWRDLGRNADAERIQHAYDRADNANSLDQVRTHNPANELIGQTFTVGHLWATPQYDRAGNATAIAQPQSPTAAFSCTYNAWNRATKIVDGDGTGAEYVFDGLNRRVIKKTCSAGLATETRHVYYSTQWQVLEERLGTATTADRQFGIRTRPRPTVATCS